MKRKVYNMQSIFRCRLLGIVCYVLRATVSFLCGLQVTFSCKGRLKDQGIENVLLESGVTLVNWARI